jgi:hypothetical protein
VILVVPSNALATKLVLRPALRKRLVVQIKMSVLKQMRTLVGVGSLTVSDATPSIVPTDALIDDTPTFFPLTTPALVTEATVVSLLDHASGK